MDALSQILDEVMRTSTLVDSLLLLSRTDSGIDDPTFTTVNLCEAMQQAVDQAMPFARDKNLTLELHIPPAPLLVIGNHDLLRRAIYILLDNSIHYTPESGLISATLSYAGEKAQLAVQDTGIGIGADQIPHVFDRFWRADKVRSRNRGGAGLGLSIAQTIVNRHKGSIEKLDKSTGRGFALFNRPAARSFRRSSRQRLNSFAGRGQHEGNAMFQLHKLYTWRFQGKCRPKLLRIDAVIREHVIVTSNGHTRLHKRCQLRGFPISTGY